MLIKKYLLPLILLIIYLQPSFAEITTTKGEYAFVEKQAGNFSYNNFLNQISAPNLFITSQCPKGGGKCWPVIKDNQGKQLRSYGTNTSLSSLAQVRYKDKAYLYFSETYTSGNKSTTNYYLLSNTNSIRKTNYLTAGSLAASINSSGQVVTLNSSGVYIEGKKKLDLPEAELEFAKFGTNEFGGMAIIAIDKAGQVYVSDLNSWIKTDVVLTSYGDRRGILSIYPTKDKLHFAIYKYVNSYNKGIIYGQTTKATQKTVSGWLFNSEIENIGFDPSLYTNKGEVIVASHNSLTEERFYFPIPLPLDEQKLTQANLEHTQGFENQKNLEFLIGAGLASLDWYAKVDIEKDKKTYATTNYDLSKSLYKSIWVQGRWGNKQLAISYAKNEAESKGGNTAKASKLFNAVFDIDKLFSERSSLRLKMEESQINGIADIKVTDTLVTDLTSKTREEFTTDFKRYSALVVKERGLFWGFAYESYQMPGTLGFSDSSKTIKYVGYDPKTSLNKYGLVLGYDQLDYLRRYENNTQGFYYDGLIGISLVDVKVSSELKNKLRTVANKELKSSLAFGIDGQLDLGYAYMRKIKQLKGAGAVINGGYRVKASYIGSSQGEKTELKPGEVALEFDRLDVWHGLYANISLVF